MLNVRLVNGVNMSEWISVEDKYPEEGAKVWYFFEHTGVSRGEFLGFHPCYAGLVDGDGNDVSHPKCKLPDCELHVIMVMFKVLTDIPKSLFVSQVEFTLCFGWL